MSGLSEIRENILRASQAAKRHDFPELVAVSKTQPVSAILKLRAAGQKIFGENYVQELIEKFSGLNSLQINDLDFHFIGHLQSNKVRLILPLVSTIHSVDSLKLYQEIKKRAEQSQKKIRVYFQVNIDAEVSKGGFAAHDLDGLVRGMNSGESPWIIPSGLMTIPNPKGDPAISFQKMQSLSRQYASALGAGLSMGMSSDYEIAIAHGATSIRIGTALFGRRD